MISHEPLMNIKQVASYLQLKESTVYTWVQEGKIPAFRMGRLWRFRRADIDKWLETYRVVSDEFENKESSTQAR